MISNSFSQAFFFPFSKRNLPLSFASSFFLPTPNFTPQPNTPTFMNGWCVDASFSSAVPPPSFRTAHAPSQSSPAAPPSEGPSSQDLPSPSVVASTV